MIAVGCATALLLRAARDTRATTGALGMTRELRHARQLVLADLSALEGRDLVRWSDTLIEFRGQLGLLVVCRLGATAIEVGAMPDERDAAWIADLRAGDELTAWQTADGVGDSLRIASRHVIGAATTMARGPCGSTGTGTTRRWSIPLALSPAVAAAGAPVIAHRPVQLVHYRSNGRWWLGRRTRSASGWDVVQPAAGPLRSAADGGLRVEARTAANRVTTVPESVAVLQLRFRALPSARAAALRGTTADSSRLDVALRAAAWSRGHP